MQYDYNTYYTSIIKPFFAPPEWVFGLAWGIIYPLIIIAFIYTLYLLWKKRVSLALFLVFVINIIANIAFTPLQLVVQSTALATLDILVVLGTLVYLEWRMVRQSKIVFWLLVPYLLWGAFATVLQVTILFLN